MHHANVSRPVIFECDRSGDKRPVHSWRSGASRRSSDEVGSCGAAEARSTDESSNGPFALAVRDASSPAWQAPTFSVRSSSEKFRNGSLKKTRAKLPTQSLWSKSRQNAEYYGQSKKKSAGGSENALTHPPKMAGGVGRKFKRNPPKIRAQWRAGSHRAQWHRGRAVVDFCKCEFHGSLVYAGGPTGEKNVR